MSSAVENGSSNPCSNRGSIFDSSKLLSPSESDIFRSPERGSSAPQVCCSSVFLSGDTNLMINGGGDDSDEEDLNIFSPQRAGTDSESEGSAGLRQSEKELMATVEELRKSGRPGVAAAAAISTTNPPSYFSDDCSIPGNSNCLPVGSVPSCTAVDPQLRFEQDGCKRKRLQTVLLRKLRNLLHAYNVRVGEQAALLTYRPGVDHATSNVQIVGSQPLTAVIESLSLQICDNVEIALGLRTSCSSSSRSPKVTDSNCRQSGSKHSELTSDREEAVGVGYVPTKSKEPSSLNVAPCCSTEELGTRGENSGCDQEINLPPLVFDGMPINLDKMMQAQLRALIPILVKVSCERATPHWGVDGYRPDWWPLGIPWANVKRDPRDMEARAQVSWSDALREIVRSCYEFYDQTEKLNPFSEEESTLSLEPSENTLSGFPSTKRLKLDANVLQGEDLQLSLPMVEQVEASQSSFNVPIEILPPASPACRSVNVSVVHTGDLQKHPLPARFASTSNKTVKPQRISISCSKPFITSPINYHLVSTPVNFTNKISSINQEVSLLGNAAVERNLMKKPSAIVSVPLAIDGAVTNGDIDRFVRRQRLSGVGSVKQESPFSINDKNIWNVVAPKQADLRFTAISNAAAGVVSKFAGSEPKFPGSVTKFAGSLPKIAIEKQIVTSVVHTPLPGASASFNLPAQEISENKVVRFGSASGPPPTRNINFTPTFVSNSTGFRKSLDSELTVETRISASPNSISMTNGLSRKSQNNDEGPSNSSCLLKMKDFIADGCQPPEGGHGTVTMSDFVCDAGDMDSSLLAESELKELLN